MGGGADVSRNETEVAAANASAAGVGEHHEGNSGGGRG